MHLKVGKTVAADGIPAKNGFDLPRGAGSTAKAKRRAIIPDPRNDENLAVAQTHAAMIRFHNRVLDSLPASVPAAQRFAQARELVTKHYQWMVRTDYLPRICRKSAVDNVFNSGRKVFEVGATPTDVPTMPIEFSVAGFRLGHSMIRAAYNWNLIFDDGFGTLDFLFTFSATSGNLGGETRLPSNWIADFRRLYDFSEAGRADLAVPAAKFNRAKAIDTHLVDPLANLRPQSLGASGIPEGDPRRNLAFRNLTRARMVRLATGQQMATFMKSKGVNFPKLSKAQIRDGKNGVTLDGADPEAAHRAAQGHPAVVLPPARGRVQRRRAAGRRRADRRGDVPPRDRGQPVLDRPRPRVAADARPELDDVPDGRPAAVRLRGQEDAARAGRLATPRRAARRRAACRAGSGPSRRG